MARPPALRDFDRQQRARVARELDAVRRTGRDRAPIAPLPADPSRCRWCSRRLIALFDGEPATYCQGGCQRNDLHSYSHDCRECRRPFESGDPRAVLCYECDRTESAQYAQEPGDVRRRRDAFGDRQRSLAREDAGRDGA